MDTSTDRRTVRRYIADMPVGRKLFAGFASLTLVLGLMVVCLFITVSRLGDANRQIVNVAAKRSQLADELRFAAADLRATQQAYVMDGTGSRSTFDESASHFESTLEELRMTVDGPVQDALITKIMTGYHTFLATDQLIFDAVQHSNDFLARNLTLGAESLDAGFIATDADQLAVLADAERDDAVRAFNQTSTYARNLGIVLSVLALAVMFLASWLITRLIRDPLSRVQVAAERAAEGDLDAAAEVDSDDETGRLARAFNRMLAKLQTREEMLLADHHRQETQSRIHRALEMADDEPAALEVVGRTLDDLLHGRSAEVLLADSSKANLEQAVVAGANPDGPGCPVSSPYSCVAVRSGTAVTFPSSNALDACPHLRNRGGDPCSAVCVPVSFMGRAMGVIHAVAEDGATASAEVVDALSNLSTQSGARIGMLRTMVRTSLQASTDSLTGLMNRRTFQSRIRAMRRSGIGFAMVMADIDHFKRLNDTHGHETGDRALKTYCDVATTTLRTSDLMCRWGGEEFAFALVGLTPEEASEVLDRVRLELSARLSTSDLPGFTVSYGIVAADHCATLDEAVRFADDALYEAKAAGRDCRIIAQTEGPIEPADVRVQPARVAEHAMSVPTGVLARLAHDDDPMDT